MTENTSAVGFAANLPIEDPRSLEDVTVPVGELGPHDLLVEVQAVSVNPVDVKVRASRDPAGGIEVIGYDAAGVVVEAGAEASLFAVGDEVFYAGQIDRPGTNSARHVVDERIVGPKPSTLSFAEAAALPLTSITAWEGLFHKLKLTSESQGTLLVVGGSGGVGSVILQLAEVLLPGVTVIATSSRPATDEWVRSLGAETTVNHRADLLAEIQAVAPDGVDWIFSTQSAGRSDLFVEVLKPFGEVVVIDGASDADLDKLKAKSLSWHWELMFTRPVQRSADMIEQHRLLAEVARLVDDGRMRTTATTVLQPLDAERLREAHRLVEDGHVIGKVVVAR